MQGTGYASEVYGCYRQGICGTRTGAPAGAHSRSGARRVVITNVLEDVKDLVLGTSIADYKQALNTVRDWLNANIKDDMRGLQTFDRRTGIHLVTAIEAPLLDLLGKFLNVPAALMGDGIQRRRIQFLSYLFYVGDPKRLLESGRIFGERPPAQRVLGLLRGPLRGGECLLRPGDHG